MADSDRAKILILADQPASARRWAEMLEGLDADLWLSPAEVPPDVRPEIILTDSRPVDDPEVGVVRIGGGGAADVTLSEDMTARELQLACRLLAQIVRLRRRERSAAELRRRLIEQSLTDPVTGLPNRRAWDEALAARLAAPGRAPLCLAVLDLDCFKRINDTHGHAVGDEVLRAAGEALCAGLRQEDFVARLGGDEFGLLLWVPNAASAATVVERVRAELPHRLVQAGTHRISASAGYCLSSPESPCSPGDLFAAADAAQREAKRRGRDCTVAGVPPG
jgi:diguanylate cyclase (GGDEF)-like protein